MTALVILTYLVTGALLMRQVAPAPKARQTVDYLLAGLGTVLWLPVLLVAGSLALVGALALAGTKEKEAADVR